MMFEFTRRSGARPSSDAPTFQVDHLSRHHPARGAIDVSHLIDRTYDYCSPRELRWHLAERFGMAPGAVGLRETP